MTAKSDKFDGKKFASLIEDAIEKEGEVLLAQAEALNNNHEFNISEQFEARILKTIDDEDAKRRRKRSALKLAKVASVALVSVTVLGWLLYENVEAFRMEVIGLVNEWRGNEELVGYKDEFLYEKTFDARDLGLHDVYLPTVLPDGFELDSFESVGNAVQLEFMNSSDYISYLTYDSKNKLYVDYDNLISSEDIKTGKYYATYYEYTSRAQIVVTLDNENTLVQIITTLSKESIVEFVDSIEFIK